jgi:hypothetical protein
MKIRLYKIISIPRNTTTAEKNIPVYLSVNRDNCFPAGSLSLASDARNFVSMIIYKRLEYIYTKPQTE